MPSIICGAYKPDEVIERSGDFRFWHISDMA
jgi:hypothetical protein